MREVHGPLVGAEVHVAKLRMLVEAKGAPKERIWLPRQAIRDVERACIRFRYDRFASLKRREAVRAGKAFDAKFLAYSIQSATGATICIPDEDCARAFCSRADNLLSHPLRDPIRGEVPLRRKTPKPNVRETPLREHRIELARDHAAGDHDDI